MTEENKDLVRNYFQQKGEYIVRYSYGYGFQIATTIEEIETALNNRYVISVYELKPFENAEEFINDQKKYGPYIMYNPSYKIDFNDFSVNVPIAVTNYGIDISVFNNVKFFDFATLTKLFTWYCKRPIGKEGERVFYSLDK